jgi:hypothetical protein
MEWKQQPPDSEILQNTARKPVRDGGFGLTTWSKADRTLPLWCGRKFDVYGHLVAPLRRASGNNLFVLGSKSAVRLLMLGNALASLRSMRRLDDCEILLLDGVGDEQPGAGVLATALDFLRAAGVRAERVVPETAMPALERFAAAPRSANVEAFRVLILSEPERFSELESPQGYGPPPAGPSRLFKDLLKTGPVQGTHTIVTAGNLAALTSVVGRDLNLFQHRIVQQTNDDESMNLFSSTVATTIDAQTGGGEAGHGMGALYVDTLQGWREGQFFKCYAASRDRHGDQSAAGFTAALRGIYGAL